MEKEANTDYINTIIYEQNIDDTITVSESDELENISIDI